MLKSRLTHVRYCTATYHLSVNESLIYATIHDFNYKVFSPQCEYLLIVAPTVAKPC